MKISKVHILLYYTFPFLIDLWPEVTPDLNSKQLLFLPSSLKLSLFFPLFAKRSRIFPQKHIDLALNTADLLVDVGRDSRHCRCLKGPN